ncbi:hypothetical protein [Halosimplex sp. TS25]|uniref:hypothetical protein n=1 Tax=Halosimplex rarum TaxID=3396619 RepID=UPI0039EBEFBE
MRPLHTGPLALATLAPLHAGPPRLLSESVLGVFVGVVVVVLYLAALRWTGSDGPDTASEGTRNRDRGTN